jgi:hypothetical protein
MRMMLVAAALSVLAGASTEALSQESSCGLREDRIRRLERRMNDAEDVIVEQVLAFRHQVETLEDQVRVLQAEVATLRAVLVPARGHGWVPIRKPSLPATSPQGFN